MMSIYAGSNELAVMKMFEGRESIDLGDWKWDL